MSRRQRLFEIIQIGNRSDIPSYLFDLILSVLIIVSIAVTFLDTFDSLSAFHTAFKITEYVILGVFTLEYIFRLFTADLLYPKLKRSKAVFKFMVSVEGLIELLTILPLILLDGFVVFRLLRVIRIFRLFQINAKYDSFSIIWLVLQDKWRPICSSVVIILIFMLASALGIYSVEHDAQPEVFTNAFSSIWWSMATLFTIGYGDIYPITFFGRLFGIILAFLGVALVAIPTGIISAGFVEQYTLRSSETKPLADIERIGEIKITPDHEMFGRTIAQVSSDYVVVVYLVIRKGMKLIPSDDLVLEDGDIMILESVRIEKK